MQHPRDGHYYDPHHDDRPEDHPGERPEDRQGMHRSGRRRAAPAPRRHAKRGWTYQGIGTVVAGTVAIVAVAAGTVIIGGTGGDDASPTGRTAADAGRGRGPAETVTEGAAAGVGDRTSSPSPSTAAAAGSASPGPSASASPGPSGHPATPSGGIAEGKHPATAPVRATETPTARTPAPADPATPRAVPPARPDAAPGRAAAEHIHRVVALANAERARAGCPALRVNTRLQAAAQDHADDMAARDYYEHDTPEGRDAGDRMRSAGYLWQTWGENIHRGPKDPATAMRDWMESPGHRENILNCGFRDIGVGVNLGSNGPWWVQNFGIGG